MKLCKESNKKAEVRQKGDISHFPTLETRNNSNHPTGSTRDLDTDYLQMQIDEAYETIVHWKKNIFEVPKGTHRKQFVKEITLWVQRWNNNTKYREFALKAVMILPTLMLQNTTRTCYNLK